MFRRIVTSPWVSLIAGLILLATGLSEVVSDVDTLSFTSIGAQHGAVFFGLAYALKALAEMFEVAAEVEESRAVEQLSEQLRRR